MKRRTAILFTALLITVCAKAQTVINSKGTTVTFDTSKWALSGTNIYNKNSGNVGIGTQAPSRLLEVNGEAKTTRLISRGPGDNSFNVAIGDSSLSSISGGYNIGIGYKALFNQVSGLYNVAVGQYALSESVTGSSNMAIGTNALKNATGNNNVAVGKDALYANTTGLQNVGIGAGALRNLTTGAQNIAIGFQTGFGITTGSKNTIIGNNVTFAAGDAGLTNTIVIGDGDGTKRVYINSAGATGIGTVVPTSRLSVNGYVKLGASDSYADTMATASDRAGMIRYNSGSQALQYHNNAQWVNLQSSSAAGDSTNDGWTEDAANSQVKLAYQSNGSTTRSAGTEFVIKDDGKVGIGTTAPNATLHVAGSMAANIIFVSNNITLDETHCYVVLSVANNFTITLPAASTCRGRTYYIKRPGSTGTKTISSYITLAGTAATTLPVNSVVVLVSDGTSWQQF